MAQKDWNAGIIRPVPVAPTGPFQDGAAPGVWTLDQVAYWTQQGLWPTAGNIAQYGVFAGGDRGGASWRSSCTACGWTALSSALPGWRRSHELSTPRTDQVLR
jgi:hypothetical protein